MEEDNRATSNALAGEEVSKGGAILQQIVPYQNPQLQHRTLRDHGKGWNATIAKIVKVIDRVVNAAWYVVSCLSYVCLSYVVWIPYP